MPRLRHLLLKLIAGTDFEISAEVSGSHKSVEEPKRLVRIENELEGLLEVLKHTGEPVFFSTLSAAARHAEESGSKVFVSVQDRFNAPQLRGHGSGNSIKREGLCFVRERNGRRL
jgi:hypothetical protein